MIKKHRETLDDLLAPHCSEGLRRGVDFVYAHTWAIPREKALDLIEEIEAEQNKCQGLVSFNLLRYVIGVSQEMLYFVMFYEN